MSSNAPTPDFRSKSPTIVLFALLLAICLAYANSFHNGFHFDDFHTVTDNPAIRDFHNIPRFFTDTTTFSVLPANRTYRPIVSTMLAVDYALGHGYIPLWFHLSTFLFFLLLVALLNQLYRLVYNKTDGPTPLNAWLALAAAAWFGLHPAMAETVNYVIQRGDLYCTLGCVAALTLYAGSPRLRRTGLYLLPYAFALLSKPPAAVFPLLLGLYVWFFEADQQPTPAPRAKRSFLALLPSVLVTAALLALQSAMTPRTFLPSTLSAADYRLTQPYVWLRYCAALILPLHLNVDTDLPAFSTLNAQAIAGLVFLAVLLAVIWHTAQRRRLYPIAYGLLWFVLTQLPTSLYPLSEVENDHRMFFSFVGLILAVVWAARLLAENLPAQLRTPHLRTPHLRNALAVFVLLALTGYAYGVHLRNRVWHDEESLWLDDVQKSPHNGRGLMIYGLTQMAKGAYPTALDDFTRALIYTPNYPTLEINLGVVNGAMADQGDPTRAAQADAHFRRAISLAPNDDSTHAFYGRWLARHNRTAEAIAQLALAVQLNPSRLMQHEELIAAYQAAGDPEAAKQAAVETLKIAPDDIPAQQALLHPATDSAANWINRSLAQYQQAQYPQSIASAQHALALDPHSAEAWNNIGAAYGAMRLWDKAIEAEQRALALNPTLQIARNNLAWYSQQKALPTSPNPPIAIGSSPNAPPTVDDLLNLSLSLNRAGKFPESIAAARRALVLNPKSAEAWNNIAAGYESLQQWDNAINAAQHAIALKPDFQLAKNNLAWSLSQKQQPH